MGKTESLNNNNDNKKKEKKIIIKKSGQMRYCGVMDDTGV